ncbi:hypothetical protein FVB32_13725 [Flagellimonas hymeniacidonis]|uniref:Outer membrane protein beta-barrel domain-containing protein n=1 Tax=Flagellimonas hymeniacidonis TaxID=2603628 RepID=A0A5C8V1H5_9FLAO|nr:hypothetical protein [Flagellimonas hymeniacidonis]TXN35633.1 hypothetical protein FVB32_13725 [Flagellimonas hymeniacidonis]
MRITTLFTGLFLFATIVASAQDISEHALGLRLGDSDGFGAEISYQKSIGRYNRAEFNLGWRDSRQFDAFKLSGVYQWVHQLDGNFNWYYGVGGGLGSVEFEQVPNGDDNDGLFVFAAGDIGVEYNFDIPLLLSLDFRPEIGILGYDGFDNDFDFDIALGIRYQF